MKKKTAILSVIIIVLVIVALAYTTYRFYVPSETGPQKETITIVDGTGVHVKVEIPVERIVCISDGLTEVICALGGGDRIVGRDSYSTFPPSILEKPVVAESSYNPDLELLLELEPDLVIADLRLSSELRGKIEDAGVPVILDNISDPKRVKISIKTLGLILNEEEKAGEIVDYIESYENVVRERVGSLTLNEKPLVYFEWGPGWSCGAGSVYHERIVDAGGINIAAGEPIRSPILSPEYVVEKNPDIIFKSIGKTGGELVAFQNARDEILSRPGFSEVKAIKEGRVYIIDSQVGTGLPSIVGLLYVAKWFHSSLFEDIGPATIHEQLVQEFFGIELEGVFTYP